MASVPGAAVPSHLTAREQDSQQRSSLQILCRLALTKLICPILDQTRWTDNDALFNRRLAIDRRLLQQGPHESDALQRLAQPHFVSHDTPIDLLLNQTGCAAVEELIEAREKKGQPDFHRAYICIYCGLTLTPST
jgi:hypothetical protein